MSQPLFGLIPAGQPPILTPAATPTPTSYLYAIPPSAAAKPSSHIVVFILPGITLPEATAAAIYLVTPTGPGQTEPKSIKFLGGVGPGKESAIFKVERTNPLEELVIGISVEPADSVAARITELGAAAGGGAGTGAGSAAGSGALVPLSAAQKQQPSTLVLAQRIIKNAFNFLASFSGTAGPNQVEVVPLRAFEEWWKKFEGRIRSDPGFLERDE
ncbi:DUF775 domain-containing protein [Echria macrotheca]|uniref:DUF775 domain-containing protein n=1 Tax=Echria macrotheca TaxID=438768 RepID=A0AAJ0FC12_9PEZI|nr:DUF775 domain-containing protein [Echria macrotheca]